MPPRTRKETRRGTSPPLSQGVVLAIALLAAAGVGLSAYLTYLDYSGAQTAFCTEGSGCDIVRESEYSRLLGIPVALIGALGYAAIVLAAIGSWRASVKRVSIFLLALGAVTSSAYFTYLQFAVIDATCPYCLASAGLTVIIFASTLVLRPWDIIPAGRLAQLSVALVALALVLWPLLPKDFEGKASTDFQVALARHLTEQGAAMYGAYWCPACAKQKELFGDAFRYITYVECDPGGENPQPALCQQKGIRRYPTWEMRGRFYEGVIPLESLARLSGYEGQP